jgi:hypothetical protein
METAAAISAGRIPDTDWPCGLHNVLGWGQPFSMAFASKTYHWRYGNSSTSFNGFACDQFQLAARNTRSASG